MMSTISFFAAADLSDPTDPEPALGVPRETKSPAADSAAGRIVFP
jgi:hypothetical protein